MIPEMPRLALLFFCVLFTAAASDELTVYQLLAPASHQFAIIYDMATTTEGAPYLFNPIRRGSVASDERADCGRDDADGEPGSPPARTADAEERTHSDACCQTR